MDLDPDKCLVATFLVRVYFFVLSKAPKKRTTPLSLKLKFSSFQPQDLSAQNPRIFNPPLWWNQNSQAFAVQNVTRQRSNGSGRTWKWQAWKYRGETGGKRVTEERVACFSGREKAPFKSDSLTISHPVKHSPLLPIHKPQYTLRLLKEPLFFPPYLIFFFPCFCLLVALPFVVWVFGLLQDSGLGETTVPDAQRRVEGALRFAPKKERGRSWADQDDFKAKAATIYELFRERGSMLVSLSDAN